MAYSCKVISYLFAAYFVKCDLSHLHSWNVSQVVSSYCNVLY
jgi:hypothetical protein